jgi:glycosyltransferase involved in cell wall biosynthesis
LIHLHPAHTRHFPVARPTPELSIVVPIYNEAENVLEIWSRVDKTMADLGQTFEVLFVDDGSTGATLELLDSLACANPEIVIIRLSRNFGQQAAITAGLEHARGRAVIVMDGDLQDPPELIPDLVDLWKDGHDVVYAVRRRRRETVVKRIAYKAFYRLLGAISELPIPLDTGDFCLMDRRVVDEVNRLPEQARFIRGLRSFVGFHQTALSYDRPARSAGRPKYTVRKLLLLAIDGLVSFSSYPLRMVTYLGIASATLSFGLGIWVMNDAIANHSAPQGWASTLVVVLFMGSIQLLSLGVVGEYIRLIFIETKRRPSHIVAEIRRHDPVNEMRSVPPGLHASRPRIAAAAAESNS